jgi:hypothetical protein
MRAPRSACITIGENPIRGKVAAARNSADIEGGNKLNKARYEDVSGCNAKSVNVYFKAPKTFHIIEVDGVHELRRQNWC